MQVWCPRCAPGIGPLAPGLNSIAGMMQRKRGERIYEVQYLLENRSASRRAATPPCARSAAPARGARGKADRRPTALTPQVAVLKIALLIALGLDAALAFGTVPSTDDVSLTLLNDMGCCASGADWRVAPIDRASHGFAVEIDLRASSPAIVPRNEIAEGRLKLTRLFSRDRERRDHQPRPLAA